MQMVLDKMFAAMAASSPMDPEGRLYQEQHDVAELCEDGYCDKENAEALEMLLEMGKRSGSPISVNFTVFSGATPLQLAALANGAARMSVLLKYGADPNMLSADMGHETALHIAARYCYPECVGMLLEAGANPLLPDAAGQSPLDLAGKGLLTGGNNADTLKQTRALLEKYTSKFEGHLRSRSVKGTSSSSTTGTPGQTASGSGAAVHKDSCDLCGQVPEGRKIQKCGQCGLRGYCSRECQVKDWPIHKIPCQQVKHFKERLSVLLTPGQSGNEILQLAHMLPQKPALQKLALDLKAIPKVLAAMPNDKAVRGGWLPTLTCVLGWLRDLDACGSAPSPQSALNPLAVQQFVNAGGPVLLLQQLSRADVCDDMRVDAMRGLSGVIRLKQGNKPLVTKGLAQDVVRLLAPWAANKSEKLMTNAAFCLAHLLRAEQHHLRQQPTAQPDQATDEQQKDTSELPPVAAAVLKHVDLKRLALAAGPSRPSGPYPGQYYQACLEFFCTLLDSKQTFKAIKTQHKALLQLLLENVTSGVGIAAVDGWATNTEILIQCYRYGGIELIASELGPIILQYPVDWDEHDPLTASAARGSGFVSADQVSAGQPLMCRMLFVSCLLDAAEHKEEMHKLSTCSIKCWRNGAVLLRACWDAIPELRTCYPEFLDRVFDLMNTRPAQKELFQDTLNRCCCQMQGQLLGQPFPSQDEYLAALRRDPSACDILCKCLGLEVQGSGKSSREVLTSIMTSMSKFRAHMGLSFVLARNWTVGYIC